MYAKPSKDMSPKSAPLLLTTPVNSVVSELRAGPPPAQLTPDEVSKLFVEVSKLVYGSGQDG